MLKTWFSTYKWAALAVAFLIYSISVWNISGTVTSAVYLRDQVKQQEQFIVLQANNDKLKNDISKMLQETLKKTQEDNRLITEDIIREVLKDPVYKSCLVTDGVRGALKQKLHSQGS